MLGRTRARDFHRWWMSELLHIQPWDMDGLELHEYVAAHYYLHARNEG